MVNDSPRLTSLVTELRVIGNLPALDANVTALCNLTADPLTCTADS
jgi:hypothetical protein